MGNQIGFWLLFVLLWGSPAQSKTLNGFDLKGALIPIEEIYSGGPPKDGIPAIDEPHFISSEEALSKYNSKEKAIFVTHQGTTRAYPLAIMVWHELVNDTLQGKSLAITYCPLCGSAMVFETDADLKSFGVSGLLFQSDMLLYDRATQSLWSQIMRKAVAGKKKGETLKIFPSDVKPLHATLQSNPKIQVLSSNTGHKRAYWRNPYKGYEDSAAIYYPIKNQDESIHPKEWTLFLSGGKKEILVPMEKLAKNKNEFFVKTLNVTIKYDVKTKVFECPVAVDVECFAGYWFALRAFYPEASVEDENSTKQSR